MVNQYQMAKKYCGDDWENCKPKLEEKVYDSQFEKATDQSTNEPKPQSENKKSLTSKNEVKNILDGKGEEKTKNINNSNNLNRGNEYDQSYEKDIKVNIPKYAMSSSSMPESMGKSRDYYGRVDPVNNEIVLNE